MTPVPAIVACLAVIAGGAVATTTATAAATGAGAAPPSASARVWATYPDRSALLSEMPTLSFGKVSGHLTPVAVDDATTYQTVAGFGGSLTESGAHVLDQLSSGARQAVMSRLFDPAGGIGVSYLRQPLGASDFALSDYTFDDGGADPALADFSTARDRQDVLPLIQAAHAINPSLRLMLTPWSAPAWMKDSGSLIGGSLLPSDTSVYASYLARAAADYQAYGAPVDAVTLQNEPDHSPTDYPGMPMTAAQEDSLAGATATALSGAGLGGVKVVGNDDDWSDYQRAEGVLAGSAAVSGTAFHCYAGDVSDQGLVHAAYPGRDVYLSECSGGSWGSGFGGDLDWEMNNLFIGGLRNWARTVTLWNLVLDPSGGPHTGGCTDCRGVLTVDPTTGTVTANAEYYALGQVSRFVKPGAVRVASTDTPGGLRSVAFRNPDGTHAVVVMNAAAAPTPFRIVWSGEQLSTSLPAGGVASYVW